MRRGISFSLAAQIHYTCTPDREQVRIVSINLNQRLGNASSRTRFERWLSGRKAGLVLGQEPWRPTNEREIDLQGFDLLERTRLLGCWLAAGPSRRRW